MNIDELSNDLLFQILENLEFMDIAELSRISFKMYNIIFRYQPFRNGTIYFSIKKFQSVNFVLVLAANDGDLRLVKYLVENKGANNYQDATANTRHPNIISYLTDKFASKKILIDDIPEVFNVRKFSMESLGHSPKICVISKPACGNSTFMKDLLYHLSKQSDINFALAMCGGQNDTYSEIIGDVFVYDDFNQEALERYWDRQQKMVRKNGKGHPDNKSLLVLDQVIYNANINDNRTIRDMMWNGRCWESSLIWSMQYPLDIKPDIRTCFDLIFISRETNLRNKRKIYEHYCGMFPTFQIFCKVLDEITQNYVFLVIDNRIHSNKIEDKIFWYKANFHQPSDYNFKSKEYSDRVVKKI